MDTNRYSLLLFVVCTFTVRALYLFPWPHWCSAGDSAADDATRKAHFFASAPSLALAKLLLELVEDKVEAAKACVDAAE